MTFDRALGQIQTARYKLVRMTIADQGGDLLLPVSEHAEPLVVSFRYSRKFQGRFQAMQRRAVTWSRCQY